MKQSFYAAVVFAFIAVACGGRVDQDPEVNGDVPSDNSFEPNLEGTGGSVSDDRNDNVPDETGGRQASPSTGGQPATGGSLPAMPSTGGAVSSTGGLPTSTGGVLVSTGGMPSTGGNVEVATGGSEIATGGSAGTTVATAVIDIERCACFLRIGFCSDESNTPFLAFTVTAQEGDLALASVSVSRTGTLSVEDIADVSIGIMSPDSNNEHWQWLPVSDVVTPQLGVTTIPFTEPLLIPAGETTMLYVLASHGGNVGDTNAFWVEGVTFNGEVDVQAEFPITRFEMSLVGEQYCSTDEEGRAEESDCGPFTILDDYGEEHEVGSYLEFNLNPDSPSGTIDSGLQTVLTVDATAHCGDIALKRVLLQTVSEWGGGMKWMWRLQEVVTGVSFQNEGIQVFHGYGPDHAELPDSSVTGMYWDHIFSFRDEPILIPEGETFTFSLQITLDDLHLPMGTIRYNLYGRADWYDVSDPDAYPEDIMFEGVLGHELTYRGTIDGQASYCEPWSTDGKSYGYVGCCGTFTQLDEAPPAGSLFKGNASAVYYMASNGKRYLMPTSEVIDSWYGPLNWDAPSGDYQWSERLALFPEQHSAVCNAVLEVSDAVLAGIELGGNVTFCPGTYATGFVSEEERYIVAAGNQLRQIDETVATELFGAEARDMIFGSIANIERPLLLTPEFMRGEYVIGEPLTDASEYSIWQGRIDGIESVLGIQ